MVGNSNQSKVTEQANDGSGFDADNIDPEVSD